MAVGVEDIGLQERGIQRSLLKLATLGGSIELWDESCLGLGIGISWGLTSNCSVTSRCEKVTQPDQSWASFRVIASKGFLPLMLPEVSTTLAAKRDEIL